MRVPFKNFGSEWNARVASEIRRDFEELENSWSAGTSLFDAIIDASLAASVPGSHQYVNLTELSANETWGPTEFFVAGVRATTTTITETGTITLPGPLAVVAMGSINAMASGGYASWPIATPNRQVWDLNGHTIFANTDGDAYDVYIRGMHIKNTGAVISGIYKGLFNF